jgi:hypothetical protein
VRFAVHRNGARRKEVGSWHLARRSVEPAGRGKRTRPSGALSRSVPGMPPRATAQPQPEFFRRCQAPSEPPRKLSAGSISRNSSNPHRRDVPSPTTSDCQTAPAFDDPRQRSPSAGASRQRARRTDVGMGFAEGGWLPYIRPRSLARRWGRQATVNHGLSARKITALLDPEPLAPTR